MRLYGRIHRIWWHHSDTHTGSLWLWRPLCWATGHTPDSYGGCVICGKGGVHG